MCDCRGVLKQAPACVTLTRYSTVPSRLAHGPRVRLIRLVAHPQSGTGKSSRLGCQPFPPWGPRGQSATAGALRHSAWPPGRAAIPVGGCDTPVPTRRCSWGRSGVRRGCPPASGRGMWGSRRSRRVGAWGRPPSSTAQYVPLLAPWSGWGFQSDRERYNSYHQTLTCRLRAHSNESAYPLGWWMSLALLGELGEGAAREGAVATLHGVTRRMSAAWLQKSENEHEGQCTELARCLLASAPHQSSLVLNNKRFTLQPQQRAIGRQHQWSRACNEKGGYNLTKWQKRTVVALLGASYMMRGDEREREMSANWPVGHR